MGLLLVRSAERVVGEEGLHVLVRPQVGSSVVGCGWCRLLPGDVGCDAGPDDGGAVARSGPGGTRAMAVEAVAEAAAFVGEEVVLALPALAVGRVEGVEVEVAAERVERLTGRGGAESVDWVAEVGEGSVELLVAVVGP